jgi:hypothetical protein
MDSAKFISRIKNQIADRERDWRLFQFNRQITNNAQLEPEKQAVAFFAASTRLTGISLNAAFSYLTACGLQLAGVPVVYFACQEGMSRCVLGTEWSDPDQAPPCRACISQSQRLYAHAPAIWFTYQQDEGLREMLEPLSVSQLIEFEYQAPEKLNTAEQIPLGRLVLPSLRWATRLYNLNDDETTRFIFREYILSAWHVSNEFASFLVQVEPQVVVVFNGILYPEATGRWVAAQHGVRVITHEVGFKPFSAFFSAQDATAYPIEIPADYKLSEEQNTALDQYLGQRFKGQFTMAGIEFWPEMKGLGEHFLQKVEDFKQVVPVFTNIIFDTSQIHANTVFTDMFAWLDLILEIIRNNPETLFVIRAHPDELRTGKESRQSVLDWIASKNVTDLPNCIFVHPNEHLSSYELILRSKFVLVYNSSIGLEAALLGKAVLCGGMARYTPYNTVYFLDSPQDYQRLVGEFISTEGELKIPEVMLENARKFMYFQLFKASLPFDEFLQEDTRPGYVKLKSVNWRQLKTENSQTMQTLVDGILHEKPFILGSGEQL